MSHLYNHIQQQTDAPFPQLKRKDSSSSSKDASEISDLTLEHALKPAPQGTLLPTEDAAEDDVPPEKLLKDETEEAEQVSRDDPEELKDDPEELKDDPEELKDDPEEGAICNLNDDPDAGGSVYTEEQELSTTEPASVAVSEHVSDFISDEDSVGNGFTVLSGGEETLESMQYSEQASLAENSDKNDVEADVKADADVLADGVDDHDDINTVPTPTDGNVQGPFRKYRWYILGAFVIAIIASVVAVVVVVVTQDNDNGSLSRQGSSGADDIKMKSPDTPILPNLPPPTLPPPTAPVPTLSPTALPTTTIPTVSPTSSLTARSTTEELIESVAFDGGEALRQAGTPQNQALKWLLGNQGVDDFSAYNKLQRYALATFYYATEGEVEWVDFLNWVTDESVCNWNNTAVESVRCSSDGSALVALDLKINGLTGPVPAELAHANQITLLSVFGNSLTGAIPVEIFTEMTDLIYLDIYDNTLKGTIPTEIGLLTDLQYIDFDSNRFTGTIPTEIGNLQSVRTVWLNNNNLEGTIPTEMAQMRVLEDLFLEGNGLNGTVPEVMCTILTVDITVSCGLSCSCCQNDCPTTSPTRSPVTLGVGAENLRTLLTSVAFDDGVALNALGTPQNQAFQWLGSTASLDSWNEKQLIERYALATFFFSTGGDTWDSNVNWLSDNDICTWFGDQAIGCNGSVFRTLFLPGNNLVGTLPIELVHVVTLQNIDLKKNKLSSTLPTEYFSNLQLQILDLFDNEIGGFLPSELGLQTFLRYIDFDTNSFEGSIPTQVGQLEALETIWLNDNLLTGAIPTEFSQLENLVNLFMVGNALTGAVALSLCGLDLVELQASCDLSCECCTNDCAEEGVTRPPRPPSMAPTAASPTTLIPTSVAMSRITTLLSSVSFDGGSALITPGTPQNEAHNWLVGSESAEAMSDERLVQRYALAVFYFSTGGLTWNMQGAWLTDANECFWYTGEEGSPVCTDDRIDMLDLDNNNLVGTIPPELALLSNIRMLDFFNNFLVGSLPTHLGLLTNLDVVFDLDSNQLTGTLPTELGNLTKLEILWLKGNSFTGTVPSEYGNMINLDELYLHENPGLVGMVPSGLCALNLITLQVDCALLLCACCNPACQVVPSDIDLLFTAVSLVSFDEGASLLTEGSPQQSALIWLAGNSGLSGYEIPQLIQRYVMATLYYSTSGPNWKNQRGWLTDINECLWFNNITSGSACDSNGDMQRLVVDANSLGGSIPAELALLSNSLFFIDLSGNDIISTIPTELGLLTVLSWVDLFNNFLSGTIPTEIGLLTDMLTLSTRNNALSGIIPTEVGALEELKHIDMAQNNDLAGTLPTELGLLTELTLLSVFLTQIAGTIPTELAQLTGLAFLYLDGTLLTGAVPSPICNITTLDFWGDCSEIVCPCCTTCCMDGVEQVCNTINP